MHLEEDLLRYAILLIWKHLYEDCMCGFVGKASRFDGQIPVYSTYRCWNRLQQCFEAAKCVIGDDDFGSALKLSTSSAAGGLRIAVSGLTKSLSIEAGEKRQLWCRRQDRIHRFRADLREDLQRDRRPSGGNFAPVRRL